MNRPLEFRAYHSPTNRLFEVDFFGSGYVFASGTLIPYPRAECVLMQFTGLYDSLGTKVFEGDVLYSYFPSHGREPSVEFWRLVVFKQGGFCEVADLDELQGDYMSLSLLSQVDTHSGTTLECRIVDCYYLRPDLLDFNTESAEVPTSFN